MRNKSFTKSIAVSVIAFGASLFSFGCDFNLVNYLGRNACEFLNCDVMFFIEDVLPLSGRPETAATGGTTAPAVDDDDGGGHAH